MSESPLEIADSMKFMLLCFIVVIYSSFGVASVCAQPTIVYVDPPSSLVPQIGEIFSVNISISDVTKLYGYDFILWYNTTMLDCHNVEWPAGHFLAPELGQSNIFKIKDIEDNFNETTGAVRVVTTLVGDEPSKNGSGVFVSIIFNTTTTDGPSPLKLYWPGYVYPVKLSNSDGNPIMCDATDGAITVVSESAWPLIAVLTLAALLIPLSRRRRTNKGIHKRFDTTSK